MSSPHRRPTIRRVRDWTPGTTMPPPVTTPAGTRIAQATLDDASDLLPTTIARTDLVALEAMVKTESGIRELFMPAPPSSSSVSTMEIIEAELEPVPKNSDIRELAPKPAVPKPVDSELLSLVDAYEKRAEQAAASPMTEEIDADAIEEVKKKAPVRSAPPPLPRRVTVEQRVRAFVKFVEPYVLHYSMKLVMLLKRWPELWDLRPQTKIGVLALWMALWVNVTLLFVR